MENLPIEIVKEIFESLHQEDKVNCMLVCRSWERVIKTTVLFNTIYIRSNGQLNKVVDNIHLEPQNGDRVVRLIMEAINYKLFDIKALPSLFPNIREVIIHKAVGLDNYSIKTPLSFQPWKKTIKLIADEYCNFPIYQVLRGDPCPRLTKIKLHNVFGCSSKQLIEHLKNAPNLVKLKICTHTFSLMDLEVLHNNVPLLVSFSLVKSRINALTLPINIEPVSDLKKLKLRGVHYFTTEQFINLEEYLSKKYPRITQLAFYFDFTNGSNLKYSINRGFEIQIQHISSDLTSLEFLTSESGIQFIFPILDRNNCKIKKLTIIRPLQGLDFFQITRSNQAQYIEILSCKLVYLSNVINNFHYLTALTELKLSIKRYHGSVNLSTLMGEVGVNLKIFHLENAIISFNEFDILFCLKLKQLLLENCALPIGTDSFISLTFPNLRNLVMDRCSLCLPNFNMENVSLAYLELRIKLPSNNNHIMIKTTSNNDSRWYTAKKVPQINCNPISDHAFCPAMKSFPFDEYDKVPYRTYVFNSVYDILLVNVL